MPTLADIYSAADSFKRRLSDAASNPSGALSQMLGYANDRARNFNELSRQAADEAIASRNPFANGPANQALDRALVESVLAGTVNQPIKGSKLVNIPVDMVEHGEAAMPGGTLSWPTAKEKIKDYATRTTEIPPIDIVSPEGGAGKWMVVDGSHRLEAARLKGQSTIPAYVSPHDKEGLEMIAKQEPTKTIYRGLSQPFNPNQVNRVDWYTPDQELARSYGHHIIEKQLPSDFSPFDFGLRTYSTELKLGNMVDRVKDGILKSYEEGRITEAKAKNLFKKANSINSGNEYKPAANWIKDDERLTDLLKESGYNAISHVQDGIQTYGFLNK